MLKKSLKRFVTEYLPEIRAIYHKCNPFTTTVIDGSNFKKIFTTELERNVGRRYYFCFGINCNIVIRNNIVWKLACSYCLYYGKTFLLVPDSTVQTKFFTEECSTLFAPPKIK